MDNKKAVALGLFDGVHLGHRAVLSAAYEQSKNGLTASAFTFVPETASYKSGGYIYGTKTKLRLIGECGIKQTELLPFTLVRGMSGEEFAERILCERMNAAFVCCGSDFRFGKDAFCGVDELRGFGERYGFKVQVVEAVKQNGDVISSSSIRRLLSEGSIEKANELLGRSYILSGTVADGNHIGRTIDFPTINQNFGSGQLVPAYGAYSGTTCIDGVVYRIVTNIGVKPTIAGERSPLAETHILGFSGDLYGRDIQSELTGYIRPERRFGSVEELKQQIIRDVAAAENMP